MRDWFEEWSSEIKQYCEDNGLSFEKAKSMAKSWGKNNVMLGHPDPEKGKMGLLDDTPMPVVLIVTKTEQGLVFEQTEHTKKYLT